MHNLNSITFRENCHGPIASTHDITIQLDRNSRGRQREFADKIFQGASILRVAILSVDLNFQDVRCQGFAGKTIRRSSAVSPFSSA